MMPPPKGKPAARLYTRILLGLLILAVAGGLLGALAGAGGPTDPVVRPTATVPPPANLVEAAQRGTWQALAAPTPLVAPQGFMESDFLVVAGQYYLFATGSEDPAWVDVYVGRTPEELVTSPPRFTHVAPIRYPTVVKIGAVWHMWGVNPPHRWTEHWISTNADPVDFVYSDSPFKGSSLSPVVDFAVRQDPASGDLYGVGFETQDNAPLLLTHATMPEGPWQKLNYVPLSRAGGIFGDLGAPAWATAARFDPNLVFTPDGRAWVLFTGRVSSPRAAPPLDQSGIVEVDRATGKALSAPVVLFDPAAHPDLPYHYASDLNFVALPGQLPRLFGYTDNPSYPLADLDLPGPLPDAGD